MSMRAALFWIKLYWKREKKAAQSYERFELWIFACSHPLPLLVCLHRLLVGMCNKSFRCMNNSTIAECVQYVRPHKHQVLLWDLLYDLGGSGLRISQSDRCGLHTHLSLFTPASFSASELILLFTCGTDLRMFTQRCKLKSRIWFQMCLHVEMNQSQLSMQTWSDLLYCEDLCLFVWSGGLSSEKLLFSCVSAPVNIFAVNNYLLSVCFR